MKKKKFDSNAEFESIVLEKNQKVISANTKVI